MKRRLDRKRTQAGTGKVQDSTADAAATDGEEDQNEPIRPRKSPKRARRQSVIMMQAGPPDNSVQQSRLTKGIELISSALQGLAKYERADGTTSST